MVTIRSMFQLLKIQILIIYIYKRISSKFLRQKLKNGFTAGDVRWRVHSVTPPDEHRLSDIEPCFVLKVTKLRKIALILLRKKIRSSSSGGDGCEVFFPKRYKGHHRCPLLGVGRLAAVTVCQLIMGLLSWSFARRTGSAADLYRLRDACPG